MGRKKVRKYPTKQFYEDMFKEYFDAHGDEVIRDMLDRLGYESMEKLRNDEMHMAFGFDCGWTIIYPKNQEMEREWKLDNGRYDYSIFAHPTYYPQSTTVQKVQVEKAIRDLGLGDTFGCYVRLD